MFGVDDTTRTVLTSVRDLSLLSASFTCRAIDDIAGSGMQHKSTSDFIVLHGLFLFVLVP